MKRISDEVFEKLNSLDDLINLMRYTKDGKECYGIGEPETFKHRLNFFKQRIKDELPDFTIDEILKITEHFYELKQLYSFSGIEDMLAALEYEQRVENKLKKIIKVNQEMIDENEEYFETINFDDVQEVALGFGTWLNFYFEVWNSNNNTWLDSDNHAYTTEELFNEFNNEYNEKN